MLLATVLVLSWLVAVPPAQAATSPVTIRTIATKVVAAGSTTPVRPAYSKRKGVRVLSATVDVRRGSRWIVRGVRHAKVTAGTYSVTTRVTYRLRAKSRTYKVWRTQALRVTPLPAAATSAQPPTAARVVPAPSVVPSLARTSTTCDDTELVKPDGTPWTCTFSDDFSGSRLDRTKWVPQTTAASGYQIGADCFVDDPDNIAVGSGVLSLTVRKEPAPFVCSGARTGQETVQHTAGSVSTWGTFAQARGRFEFRAAFPATQVAGHHSALWLYPADPQQAFPYSGEIDVAEMYSYFPDRAIPNIHYGHWDETVTNNYCTIDDVSAFHTYTLEWTPTTMSIAFDGQVCVEHRIETLEIDPFANPFMLVLSQGLGAGFNSATSATPAVGTTKVDWVRVWK